MHLLTLTFCILIFGLASLPAEAKSEDRILFLSSYSYGWDTVKSQIQGIEETVAGKATVDYEFMDTKRVDDEESMALFYEGLKYRLEHVEAYDALIVGDDAALRFAMEHRDELFADIPVVFEGVNDEEYALKVAEDPTVTGILEKLSVEDNINLALSVMPEATRVIAILDDSVTGQAERKNFYAAQESFPNLEFSEIDCSLFQSVGLRHRIATVEDDTILIYITLSEDGDGVQYSSRQAVSMITSYAKVPVWRMVEAGIGDGLIGGNVVSMEKSGAIAAQMVLDILDGADSAEMDVELESPNIICIDEQVMKEFGFKKSQFPTETEFVNHEAGFLELYGKALFPFSVLVLALCIVIAWVGYDNYRRRRLMGELEEARSIMESASQHDFLTGLPNRSKFMEDLQGLIADDVPCTVMMLDIDDFKKINDTFGHTAGDQALQQVAGRLKALQSQILTAYRFAGDEFILILKGVQPKLVDRIAGDCRNVFAKQVVLVGEKRTITGSIGIASFPKDSGDLEQLIVCADAAMYQVKKSGKNDYAYYTLEAAAVLE